MEFGDLKLDARSRKLLEECIEHQEVVKTTISKTMLLLETCSFIIIHDVSSLFEKKIVLRPTLLGEEYMENIWNSEEHG